MKHIKKFQDKLNESTVKVEDMINQVLDNLNEKGELSKSERKFMDEATKGTVEQITIPSEPTDNFLADASNPHNIGIMWVGKDGVWEELKDLETETEDELEKTESEDEKFERVRVKNINDLGKKIPELKNVVNEWAIELYNHKQKMIEYSKKMKKISNHLPSNERYKFSTKYEHSIKNLYSLFNQFGPLIDSVIENEDDDDGFKLKGDN